jgi:hypothetical protein
MPGSRRKYSKKVERKDSPAQTWRDTREECLSGPGALSQELKPKQAPRESKTHA